MIHFIYLFLYFRFEWIYICPSSKPGRVPNKIGLGLCTKHLKSPWARNRVHQNPKSWKLLFLVFTHMILACDLPSISVAGQVHGSHGPLGSPILIITKCGDVAHAAPLNYYENFQKCYLHEPNWSTYFV